MSTKAATLSVVIATHNEAAMIGETLAAVSSLADEIIVADGESSDDTVAIAKKYGARVIAMSNKRMFHINKEEASKKATGDWILFLDADERVPPELAKEIKQVLENQHPSQHGESYLSDQQKKLFTAHQHHLEVRDGRTFGTDLPIQAYFIARKNFFLGSYLMHSGVYPDGVIRFVRSGSASWPCKDVHETMQTSGGVAWLAQPMLHLADPTFSRYLSRANRYTSLTASQLKSANVPIAWNTTISYLLIQPLSFFLKLFLRHKAFLDGFSGFVWSLFSALHFPIAYLKLVSMRYRDSIADADPVANGESR